MRDHVLTCLVYGFLGYCLSILGAGFLTLKYWLVLVPFALLNEVRNIMRNRRLRFPSLWIEND